jgi:hypothetical protein
MTRCCIILWLLTCTLVWWTLPRPQLPFVHWQRQFIVVRVPWPGRLALGVRMQVFILAR